MFFEFEKYLLAVMLLFLLQGMVCRGQETFVDDRDNNKYKTVVIGKQVWLAENMRYLPSVNSPEDISYEDIFNPKYYVYGYYGTDATEAMNSDEYSKYGALYNQKAAKSACPKGWHLPKDSEWKTLEKALGMKGGATKEIGNRGTTQGVVMAGDASLWVAKGKVDFKNQLFGKSGFMALPGGYLGIDKKFHDMGAKASFWSSTEYCEGFSYFRSIGVNSLAVYRNNSDNTTAMYVRCIKN